jgi:phosphatidylinositol alpha-1,6-mannosyltransferase
LVSTAEDLGLTASLRLLGGCSNEVLEDAYQGSDVHVFPVRDVPGDVEGFGMVAIEAASYGLPTVAFNVGGVADAVIDGVTGRLVDPDSYAAFAEEVLVWIRARAHAEMDRCAIAARRFAWTRFNDEIKAILSRGPIRYDGANDER